MHGTQYRFWSDRDLERERDRIKDMFVRYIKGIWPTGYEVKKGIFTRQEIEEIASWVIASETSPATKASV
jgi:hypothetical protein